MPAARAIWFASSPFVRRSVVAALGGPTIAPARVRTARAATVLQFVLISPPLTLADNPGRRQPALELSPYYSDYSWSARSNRIPDLAARGADAAGRGLSLSVERKPGRSLRRPDRRPLRPTPASRPSRSSDRCS